MEDKWRKKGTKDNTEQYSLQNQSTGVEKGDSTKQNLVDTDIIREIHLSHLEYQDTGIDTWRA